LIYKRGILMLLRNIKLKTKFLIMITITVILVGFIGMFSTDGIYQSKKVIQSELELNKGTIEKGMSSIENVIQLRFTTFRVNKDLNKNYTATQYEQAKKTVD